MIVKIQNRRGEYLDYDPSKLLPGEFAVVQMGDPNTPTGKGVYLAISAGDVVRLATIEEIAAYTQQFDDIYQSTIQDAQQILDNAKSLVSNYSGGLTVVSSTSSMTDTSSLYLYTGSGQYHNYVYAYDSSQSQFVPFFDYGIITEVGGVVAKSVYTTVLSATTYNDKATALAALDSYATNLGGSVRIVGYISTANSSLLGLSNTSHYMDFYVNSANYRLLVARPVNGNTIYQLAKQGGTWGSSWQQLANQASVDDISNRFLKLVSGTNVTTANINTFTTSGLYLGYIECTSITGSGGSSYGLLIVTDPPTSSDRIGQCIIMMQTGYIATRYKMNDTWSAWIPSDKLLKGRQYSSIGTMYAEMIATLDGNERTYFSASSNLVASLTNSEITNACRVIVTKADNITLDYMLFSPGANAVFIGRIGENGVVRNVTRFAKASDVSGIVWTSDTAVKITTSLTDYVASSANGVYYLWSTSTDATAVGAPSANSYHYLVVKVNSSTAIIQAHKMTTGDDTFYVKQLYGGNWGSTWTQIANQSNVTALTNKVVKNVLSTTTTYANETAETYNNLTISGLSDYAVVLVNVDCANLRQTLTFVNGDTDPQYLYEINGNNKIRGGYSVDWANNRVRVRYLSASGAYTYQNVYFSKVVGFIKL